MNKTILGQPNGIATLDENGMVPVEQLPNSGSGTDTAIKDGTLQENLNADKLDGKHADDLVRFPSSNSISIGLHANMKGANNFNTAVGAGALSSLTDGYYNTAIGGNNLAGVTTGAHNTGVGAGTLTGVTGSGNCALGSFCNNNHSYNYTTAIGYNTTAVTGNNQIQLGNSAMTVYTQSAIQLRSDMRDKADIQPFVYDTLDFILGLNPCQYLQNHRDRYRTSVLITKKEYESLEDKTGWSLCFENIPLTENEALEMTPAEIVEWENENLYYEREFERPNDGSQTGKRLHNGFIAQEVAALAKEMGFDFAGWQHHSVNGGEDVHTLAYEEFIAPLIGAFQAYVKRTDALIEGLTARIESLETK